MKKPKSTVGIAAMTAIVAGATMYAIGWRSLVGIIVASLGAGVAVALATRRSD